MSGLAVLPRGVSETANGESMATIFICSMHKTFGLYNIYAHSLSYCMHLSKGEDSGREPMCMLTDRLIQDVVGAHVVLWWLLSL